MSSNSLSIQEKLDRNAKRKEILTAVLPFTGLVFITALLLIVTDGVLIKGSNLVNLLNQCFTVSLVGVGAAFVYAHGGMDFSIGASCGLAQFVSLVILNKMGLPVYVAIIGSLLVGIVASTLVGSVAVLLRVPAFVTSLCVRSICAGLLTVGVNNSGIDMVIDYDKYLGFNSEFIKLGVLIVIIALGYFFFEKTVAGKNERAIGGNIITAFQAGVKVNKNMILAYSFLGLCVGIAAFFQLTRVGVVTAQSGSGLEFDIMIAIVLGGFPMAGGSMAKLRAVIIGALTLTVLSNGLIIWGLDVSIVNGVKGLLFIAIIAISYDRSSFKQFNMLST